MVATQRDLDDFQPLSDAEQKLIDELDSGFPVVLGNGAVPSKESSQTRIRASLIRHLAIGGCESARPHEKGVQLAGAWIDGDLDFTSCSLVGGLTLVYCRCPNRVVMLGANVANLNLCGSQLDAGLEGDAVAVNGSVLLRLIQANGEVRFLGARIAANLECDGATLRRPGGMALSFDSARIEGSVYLRVWKVDGQSHDLVIDGGVRLIGARITGSFNCSGGTFRNPDGIALEVSRAVLGNGVTLAGARVTGGALFLGADVTGNLDAGGASFSHPGNIALGFDNATIRGAVFLDRVTSDGEIRCASATIASDFDCHSSTFRHPGKIRKALNLQSAEVAGSLVLRSTKIEGALDLTAANIGVISDEPDSWPEPGGLLLDQCRYGSLTGDRVPVDAAARLKWLRLLDPSRWDAAVAFWPQPYEQLATVLRDMGHTEDARLVSLEKEKRLRRSARKDIRNPIKRMTRSLRDALLFGVVGYGWLPTRSFCWAAFFWVFGAAFFGWTQSRDSMMPNSPAVLHSPAWTLCTSTVRQTVDMSSLGQRSAFGLADETESQLACFLRQPESSSFPAFSALAYSADALIPVLDLGEQARWIPNDKTPLGWWARRYLWIHVSVGWLLSLLAIAGFSGVVKTH